MNDDREQFRRDRKIRLAAVDDSDPVWGLAREFINHAARIKYSYNFEWLGVPIIQIPQDIVAVQEIIWNVKPDLIVETGIARGGSVIFYASILKLLGNGGRVVGVDIDIRPHNRETIESHPLSSEVELIEGSSIAPEVVSQVASRVAKAVRPLVLLDSNHTHEHVLKELELYSPFVRRGSYLVVLDTSIEYMRPELMKDRDWKAGNSPMSAIHAFLKTNNRFEIDKAIDSQLLISVAPSGYLKCIED